MKVSLLPADHKVKISSDQRVHDPGYIAGLAAFPQGSGSPLAICHVGFMVKANMIWALNVGEDLGLLWEGM